VGYRKSKGGREERGFWRSPEGRLMRRQNRLMERAMRRGGY